MKKVFVDVYLTSKKTMSEDIDEVPWVEEFLPTEMKKERPDWFSKVKGDETIMQCPSFINLLNHGFVVKNPADVVVTNVNGKASIHSYMNTELGQHINGHGEQQFGSAYPFEHGFVKGAVKFENPFLSRVNRSVGLLILPCWWHKNYRDIKAFHGLIRLSPEVDTTININTSVRTPAEGEEIVIRAGDPIAHLLFIDVPEVKVAHKQEISKTRQAKRSVALAELMPMRFKSTSFVDRVKSYFLGGGHG